MKSSVRQSLAILKVPKSPDDILTLYNSLYYKVFKVILAYLAFGIGLSFLPPRTFTSF